MRVPRGRGSGAREESDVSERCAVTAPDGRQCCGPAHGPEQRHLLMQSRLDAASLDKLAERWQVRGTAASVLRLSAPLAQWDRDTLLTLIVTSHELWALRG